MSLTKYNKRAKGHIPFSTDSINLIDEHNAGRMFLSHSEHLPDKFRAITKILLDEFRPYNSQECRRCLIRDSFGQQSFSCSWYAIEDHTLWRLDTHLFVEFGVGERQLNRFLKTININIFQRI